MTWLLKSKPGSAYEAKSAVSKSWVLGTMDTKVVQSNGHKVVYLEDVYFQFWSVFLLQV